MDSNTKKEKLALVVNNINSYPDFPKEGIIFRDIFSVYTNVEALKALYDLIYAHVEPMKNNITAVCALESRGFLFGPCIALHLDIPFIPIRKCGKLPGKVEKVSYELEYGMDSMELQSGVLESGSSVLLVDDLLATGGSLAACCKLINSTGSQVYQCLVIMELEDLNGRENVPTPVHSIVQF